MNSRCVKTQIQESLHKDITSYLEWLPYQISNKIMDSLKKDIHYNGESYYEVFGEKFIYPITHQQYSKLRRYIKK